MKIVKLDGNIVREIVPEYAMPIDDYYPNDFVASCVEAPDYVYEGWVYNESDNTFSEPNNDSDNDDDNIYSDIANAIREGVDSV